MDHVYKKISAIDILSPFLHILKHYRRRVSTEGGYSEVMVVKQQRNPLNGWQLHSRQDEICGCILAQTPRKNDDNK